MFVEVDRARLTKTLAAIKEKNGDIDGAMQIMQDTQVRSALHLRASGRCQVSERIMPLM